MIEKSSLAKQTHYSSITLQIAQNIYQLLV